MRRLPATASRDFRWLWAAGTASSIALWTLFLGNAWVVFKLSDSSAWVGAATFAAMLPFFLTPIGGVVADRFERRRVLIASRAVAMVGVAVLLGLAVAGALTVWLVVLFAFLQGLVRASETPAEQALLPNVVPREALGNAIMLSTTTRLGSRAVGPVLAGPLLATVGVQGAYAIALAFMVPAVLGVARVQTTSRGGVASLSGAAASLVEGLAYVRANRGIAAVFLLVVAHCTLTMSFDALLPQLAKTNLGAPTNGLTVLVVSVGSGAFVGTLMLSLFDLRARGAFFLGTAVASGLAPILLAASQAMVPAAAGAALMGASQAMFMALAAVFIQEVVDDAVRGRVMSLYVMAAGGIMAFANLGLGSLADVWGAPAMLYVPGAAFLVIVVVSLVGLPPLRRVYGSGTIAVAPGTAG